MYLPTLPTYAQGNTDTASVSQSVGELINSVALLVGVVAPLIVSGLAYVKAKSQDPKIKEEQIQGFMWDSWQLQQQKRP